MAFAPLLLKGNLKINGTDVPSQVTSFAFHAHREAVEVPPTFGSSKSFKAGNDDYSVEIAFLQDQDATALTRIFWAALTDGAAGTITVAGTFESGATAASNPTYTATAVVTDVMTGGGFDTIGVDSVTFPLTAAPVIT